jgi:hypothetical protein
MTQNEKGLGRQAEAPKENSAPFANPIAESTQAEIVLHEQAETEVYFDEDGCLVIGQADQFDNPEVAVFITPENVQTFARAISRIAGLTEDKTSAERARRYRANKKRDVMERDAVRDANVTGRDASVTTLRIVRPSS